MGEKPCFKQQNGDRGLKETNIFLLLLHLIERYLYENVECTRSEYD